MERLSGHARDAMSYIYILFIITTVLFYDGNHLGGRGTQCLVGEVVQEKKIGLRLQSMGQDQVTAPYSSSGYPRGLQTTNGSGSEDK